MVTKGAIVLLIFTGMIQQCMFWNHPIRVWLGYIPQNMPMFFPVSLLCFHYDDVIMSAMASKITSLTIVYSTVAFVWSLVLGVWVFFNYCSKWIRVVHLTHRGRVTYIFPSKLVVPSVRVGDKVLNTLKPRQNGRLFTDNLINAFSWMKCLNFNKSFNEVCS